MTTSSLQKTLPERSFRSRRQIAKPQGWLSRLQQRLARGGAVRAGSVLLVEDDADLSSVMRLRLERAGLRVHSASDGPSGLLSYHSLSPDVVVLDLNLPGM